MSFWAKRTGSFLTFFVNACPAINPDLSEPAKRKKVKTFAFFLTYYMLVLEYVCWSDAVLDKLQKLADGG